jgi:hypothetical protein
MDDLGHTGQQLMWTVAWLRQQVAGNRAIDRNRSEKQSDLEAIHERH